MLVRDLRCSVLVGRDAELEQLLAAIERTGAGAGETVVLLGEAGVGKSRLAEAAVAAARSRGIVVLRGRATPSPAPAPYRPIAEALLSGLRAPDMHPLDGLTRFRAAFGVLVPGWSGDDVGLPADPSLILLGESVLALLGVLGGAGGVLLLLEDLHWADPGTLELLDYVVDKLAASKAALLATVRAGEASSAEKLARSLHARRQVNLVDLGRLPADDVTRMVAACLGQDHPPSELVRVVHEASDGLPFLVEEVLTALVATHSIVRTDDGWRVVGPLRPRVPPSFAATVEERMRALSSPARRVVETAAVLGDAFDLPLLGRVSGASDDEIGAALREATSLQLVEDDRDGPAFRFRHALTRAAVLATLLAPERAAIAERALAVLYVDETSDVGRLELAARLAETAGNQTRATELLLASACASLRQGALSSARVCAEKVLTSPPRPEATVRALEVLLDTSVQAGDSPRAAEVGRTLLTRLEAGGAPVERLAEVHLRLAGACVAATDWRGAQAHLASAEMLGTAEDAAMLARRRLLRARTALGQHLPGNAVEDVEAALEAAERGHLDDVRCESLELMGRIERALGLSGAERWFTLALVAAERSGSQIAQVRALLELGIIELFRLGSQERLRQAESLANDIGAPSLAAQASLHLAILLSFRFELAEARLAAQRAHDAAERYHLGLLVPAAAIVLAAVDAYMGRRSEAVATFTRALPHMDVDNEIIGRQYLALGALAVEDRAGAVEELRRAEALCPEGAPVTRSAFRPVLALLLALEGEDSRPLIAELDPASDHVLPAALAESARAVIAGRTGDPAGAARHFAQADDALRVAPWFRMVTRRLVAESALEDGWGSPEAWLEDARSFFTASGLEEPARASRSLLRRAGSKTIPGAEVTSELARLGVTRREAEVLALVGDGLSNKDIASQLYLSPRTVEKHVERLLLKTGSGNRAQLAALAARLAS